MIPLIDFLESFGDQMLEYIWFPLLVWTCIAIPIAGFLRWSKVVPPVYQYHSRIALVLALPLGLGGAFLADFFGRTVEATGTATFFVVQNPISISPTASESAASINMFSPTMWLGILGTVLVLGAVIYLLKMIVDLFQLKKMEQQLHFQPLCHCSELVSKLPAVEKHAANALVAYSDNATIPFTYGWRNTKIVIPSDLKANADDLVMAVQHELMHIKHRDYLLNGLLIFIKAIFWIHPLVHYLHNSSQEYREITCDGEVLANKEFSRKRYASLLYKLAKREHQTTLAMSMAVNPSSLKKRIQTMSSQTNVSSKFRSSIFLTLASAMLIVLTISCTDMAENGITKAEVEESQEQLKVKSSEQNPLYVVNGEVWNKDDSERKKLSRLKTKYIKSINVLKGDKATDKYSSAAKHGVVEIELNNPEKALSDLKTDEEIKQDHKKSDEQGNYFVAVEDMPELKGGLAGLQKKINYPEMARKAGIEGRVIVQFIVNEQGQVEKPQIIRGIGGGADEEALRVVKQAEFEPGMQRGKPVRVQYSLPFTFQLPKNDEIQKESTSSYLENPKMNGQKFEINNLTKNNSGMVSGTIVDASTGEPLSGANVVVQDVGKGTASNQNGKFQLQNVPSGNQEITISYVGYNKAILNLNIE